MKEEGQGQEEAGALDLDGTDVQGDIIKEEGVEGQGEQVIEEEKDDIIDPEDPLYGLDQRLKYAKLDT